MEYDYNIITRELKPPLGENKYFAKAKVYKINTGIVCDILGETWGKTKDEAYTKMKEKVEDYIKTLK